MIYCAKRDKRSSLEQSVIRDTELDFVILENQCGFSYDELSPISCSKAALLGQLFQRFLP